MQSTLISIIVPVYNVEKYLDRCLESIVKQTYSNLEIIIINDGSSDKSGILCDNWAKCDNRIKLIHKLNGGLSDARNVGLDIASGEYIGFVDSDDYISPTTYEKLIDLAVATSSDMVVCGYEYVDENGKSIDRKCPIQTTTNVSSKQYLRMISEKGNGYYITAWNKLYRKELFDSLRFPKGKVHEDNFVIHRIVDRCTNIAMTAEKLFFYTQRSSSISSGTDAIKRMDNVEALCDRICYYKERKYEELIPQSIEQLVDLHLQIRRKYLFRTKKSFMTSTRMKDIRRLVMSVIKDNVQFADEKMVSMTRYPDLWIIMMIVKERVNR